MAGKTKSVMEKAAKKPGLDIKDEMYHAGRKDFNWLANQTDEMRKSFSPLVAMKWFSVDNAEPEHYISMVNEFLNKDFWDLSNNHPDLCWRIMCAIGNGRRDGDRTHGWIKMASSRVKVSKVDQVFLDLYPMINNEELALLKSRYDVDSFKQLLRDKGMADKDIKVLTDDFKKTRG